MSTMQAEATDADAALSAAVVQHRLGNVAEAERLYRGILAARPDQADANHNLGVLAIQTGEPARALAHFQSALQADPRQPRFWLSCIDTLIRLGQTGAAVEMLARARQCCLGGPAAEALEVRLRALSRGLGVAGTNWMPDLPGAPYTQVLERLHGVLLPKTYVEIGVETGATLALARCASIGVDPRFQFGDIELVRRMAAKPRLLLYQMPSDEFFAGHHPAQLLGAPIELAFLDGMHRCEYLLRDFLNLERHCRREAVIALHDCLPLEAPMAEREPNAPAIEPRRQRMWTGDVWRTALLLKRRRTDLRMVVLDAAPTGLVLITGLDPNNRFLSERYDSLVAEMMGWSLDELTLAGYYAEMGVEAEVLLRRPEALMARLRRDLPPEPPSPASSLGKGAGGKGAGIALVPKPVAAAVSAPVPKIFPPSPLAAAPSSLVAEGVVEASAKKARKQGKRARDRHAAISAARARRPSSASEADTALAEFARLRELYKAGRYIEAEAIARSLTTRHPGQGLCWMALGAALLMQRRFQAALEADREAVRLLPGNSDALCNLGNALLKLGNLKEAEPAYGAALALHPELPEALSGLGATLHKLGRLVEAEAHFRRALSLRPDYADAHSNLGIVLYEVRRLAEAEACFRRALEINPEHADAWNNLGSTLKKLHRLGEAEAAHRRSIEIYPENVDALINLAGCLQHQARPAEAEVCYRRAIELDPEQMDAQVNLLFCLSHNLRTTPEALFAEHFRVGSLFEARLRSGWVPHSNLRDPGRRLEVGFVSGDFRVHAMSHFVEPALEQLARQPSLRLHAYTSYPLEDEMTERLRSNIPLWTPVYELSDEAFAERVRADGIDILIDLSGFTAGHRLAAFARKPAPVQCGWIGCLGTSGMECMDYYLADRFYLPPGELDHYFTEKIVRLPVVAPFRTDDSLLPAGPLPALANGHITFASFSRMGKLGPEVVALWSALLRRVPGAKMRVAAMAGRAECETVAGWFAAREIPRQALEFCLKMSPQDYLEQHREVDICLDPFPFTGATTTCHAMWMGVPTLTLEGRTAAGRLGPAMLRHVGLEDFVAATPEDFVIKGLRWARDLGALAELRSGLRERFRESPLGRPGDFADGFAQALREMWRSWCEGELPVAATRPPDRVSESV
jgi:protein O-GlcNAc transferase